MTVSSDTLQITHNCDGISTVFAVPFYFLQDPDLIVTLKKSDGSAVPLVLGTDYTVSGADDEDGGSVTTLTAYASGNSLFIERVVDITQETAYQDNDPFPAKAHETALDKLTMICQQMGRLLGFIGGTPARVLMLGDTDTNGSGAYRAGGNRIQDLGDPVNAQDATTKSWVSTLAANTYNSLITYCDRAVAGVVGGFGWFLQLGTGTVYRTFQDKMREHVTPYDFGAVGDGVADDTLALQAFANYIMANNTKVPHMMGVFKVTQKISFVGTSSAASVIRCNCQIIASFTAEDEVVSFSGWNYGTLIGSLTVTCGGGTAWTTRTNGVGILISNCSRFSAGRLSVFYAKYYGVRVINSSSLTNFDFITTGYCGTVGTGTLSKTLTVSGSTNSGSSGSTSQFSTISVDSVPAGIEPGITMCSIGGQLYFIQAADSTANTLNIYPWLDSTVTFPATLTLFLGGGLYATGGDVSCITVGTLDATGCGVGVYNRPLYPISLNSGVFQQCGVAHVLGSNLSSGTVGGQCIYSYYEDNAFDIVKLTTYNSGYIFGSASTVTYAKCLSFAPRFSSNALSGQYVGFTGIELATHGATHDLPLGTANSNIAASTNQCPTSVYNVQADTQTFTLSMSTDFNRLFGYTGLFIMAEGSGANHNPTGTYTFTPPSGGTVNGGTVNASATFSGMKCPTLFHARCVNGLNWIVTACAFSPQAVTQAASTAGDLATLVSDFNALLTKLKNAGLMAN